MDRDPTPEQIAERCEEIQRKWSEGTERYRRTGKPFSEYDGVEIKLIVLPLELAAVVSEQE